MPPRRPARAPRRRRSSPAPGSRGSRTRSPTGGRPPSTRRSPALIASSASRGSAEWRAGTVYCGRRWNTYSSATCGAISVMHCTPLEPVPITPTRLPRRSTPSCGHATVWYDLPVEASRGPRCSGSWSTTAVRRRRTRNWADRRSPPLVVIGPAVRRLVEVGARLDGGAERDAAAQVEAVGDVVQVGQDLGLPRVALVPASSR